MAASSIHRRRSLDSVRKALRLPSSGNAAADAGADAEEEAPLLPFLIVLLLVVVALLSLHRCSSDESAQAHAPLSAEARRRADASPPHTISADVKSSSIGGEATTTNCCCCCSAALAAAGLLAPPAFRATADESARTRLVVSLCSSPSRPLPLKRPRHMVSASRCAPAAAESEEEWW